MAFTLYYQARRATQITEEEQTAVKEIVREYCEKYNFKSKSEDFVVYETNEEADVIFGGATKLPGGGPRLMFDVANYWLECLDEITDVLAGCQWEVRFDDVDLIMDPEAGWRFPTDEEYGHER